MAFCEIIQWGEKFRAELQIKQYKRYMFMFASDFYWLETALLSSFIDSLGEVVIIKNICYTEHLVNLFSLNGPPPFLKKQIHVHSWSKLSTKDSCCVDVDKNNLLSLDCM
jgi:hypothetical protein